MRPVVIEYFGGPKDGAFETLDMDKLGIEDGMAFDMPHLTKPCIHMYRCPVVADAENGLSMEHLGARLRIDAEKWKKKH